MLVVCWLGDVRYGSACYSMVRLGQACYGYVRCVVLSWCSVRQAR